MSINSRIDSIKQHLENAYDSIEAKGGTIPQNKNVQNLEAAILSIEGGGTATVKLNPPTLALGNPTPTNDPLIITNIDNGTFVKNYKIYNGTTLLDTIEASLTTTTVNLKDYISESGTYTINVVATGTNVLDSNAATITYNYGNLATITNTLVNCTNSNAASYVDIGSSYTATLEANEGYTYVGATVTVTHDGVNVTSTAYDGKGHISIQTVSGNIQINATFPAITQLSTPTIALSGDNLVITPVSNAEYYDIYIGFVFWKRVTTTTIALDTQLVLQRTYSISVKAGADGYVESNASNTVSYTNSSGTTPNATLNSNNWPTIRIVCELGEATNYWSVGDTKTDVGSDGNTRTFQIVDMNGLYGKHVVFLQVELEPTNYNWDGIHSDNSSNYVISDMRLTNLPAIMNKYSSSLQNTLTNTTLTVFLGYDETGHGRGFEDITDKLFLPSRSELQYSMYNNEGGRTDIAITYQYFLDNEDKSYREKTRIGQTSPSDWWTRSGSTTYSNQGYAVYVNLIGNIFDSYVFYEKGVAPAFSF